MEEHVTCEKRFWLKQPIRACISQSLFRFSLAKLISQASFSSRIIEKTSSTLAPMYLFLLRYSQPWNDFSLLKFTQGVPIEVVPFAYFKVLQNLKHILGSPKATLRMAVKKGKLRLICAVFLTPDNHLVIAGPVVTDNGNFIIDAPFDREKMIDPYIVSNFFLSESHPKILNECR